MENFVFFLSSNTNLLPSHNDLKWLCTGEVHFPSERLLFLKEIQKIDFCIFDEPCLSLCELVKAHSPESQLILVTNLPLHEYSQQMKGQEFKYFSHILATHQKEWTINDLRVCLQKYSRKDYFGLEKYLDQNTSLTRIPVVGSQSRKDAKDQLKSFCERARLGSHLELMASGICEEMLLNALFDAPLSHGFRYNKDQFFVFPPEHVAEFSFGFDQNIFALSIKDPFGGLTKEKFFAYLSKGRLRENSQSIIDEKKEGAGLGLLKILYSSHGFVCNVAPTKCTEMIALIDLEYPNRDLAKTPRSIHYFLVD